jgi:hypothetical protein
MQVSKELVISDPGIITGVIRKSLSSDLRREGCSSTTTQNDGWLSGRLNRGGEGKQDLILVIIIYKSHLQTPE